MSSGDLCKSCKKGKLRPFQLSAFEAIVKCSNTECDSYLDFLPHETIVSTAGSASTPNSCAVSRCSSPDSPALSQYSSTDLEVATLNKSHILAKYSQKKSSLTSQAFTPSKFPSSYNAPKSALPSIAKSAFDLNDAKRYNIDLSTASLDDVDIFLDSLVGDIPSPKPSLRDSNLARGLPSDGSAFSQLPPVSKQPETFSNESIIRNDLTCLNRNLFKNRGDCVYDKLSEVCKSNIALGSSSSSSVHDSIMLDDNQFLSPAGSVVSEDSGYNDDIPIAVAVSGSGTRGGQADTKTTNSSIPSSVTQLGHDTVTVAVSQTSTLVASHSNIQRAPQTDQVAFLPAPGSCSLQSSSGNTPTQPDSVETGSITSVDSLKSTDSSTNPDIIPLPAALLLVPGLSQESELLSKLQLRPSCFRSTEEVVRNEEIGSRIIVPYAQLSLTNFLTIFEQNLATRPSVISTVSCCQKIAHQRSSPDPGDMNIKIKCPENLSDGEVSSQVSEACLSDVSESEGEFSLTDPDQHSSDSLIAGRGRPQKRKYRKRAPKHCDPVQNGNVDSSLSAQQQNIHANNENVDRLPGVQRQSSDANLPELLVNNSLPTASDGNSFQTETEAPDASRNTAGDKLLMDTRLPSVPNSVGAPTVKTKRRYGTKRKIQEEYSSAPRKSARNLANPVESRRDTSVVRASHNLSTDCQSESSSNVMLPPSLAHVRPSLAALLPPIPHHGPKHRCDGGRSNKRLKPSQPFRHLPNAGLRKWFIL